MRDILHKTESVLMGRGKIISIRETNEDKQSTAFVRKNFIYVACEADEETTPPAPHVHVEKSYDSITREERFAFRVKGFFFAYRNRRLMKIGYRHTLKIRLRWKTAPISPKKTVTMA